MSRYSRLLSSMAVSLLSAAIAVSTCAAQTPAVDTRSAVANLDTLTVNGGPEKITRLNYIFYPHAFQNLDFHQGLFWWIQLPDPSVMTLVRTPGPTGGRCVLLTSQVHNWASLQQVIRSAPYLGKRIRLSALLRTGRTNYGSQMNLRVDTADNAIFLTSACSESAGWHRCTLVADVPEDATGVSFGFDTYNGDKLLVSGIHLEIVGADVPLTPIPAQSDLPPRESRWVNRNGNVWSGEPATPVNLSFCDGLDGWDKGAEGSDASDYRAGIDRHGYHGRAPSAFLEAAIAHPTTQDAGLTQRLSADRYLGKRVRFSVAVRTWNVTNSASVGVHLDTTRTWHMYQLDPITGSQGWRRYSIVFDIPKDGQGMFFGTYLSGPGKVGMANARLEVVDDRTPLTKVNDTATDYARYPGDTSRLFAVWDDADQQDYKAALRAAGQIASDTLASPEERCTAQASVVHAEAELGNPTAARTALALFEKERSGLVIDPEVVAMAEAVGKKLSPSAP